MLLSVLFRTVKEAPEVPEDPADPEEPEEPDVPDDPEDPEVPDDPEVPEDPFKSGEYPDISSISNQGYDPVVLKSELPPNPLNELLALKILYEITVVCVVVKTKSERPPPAANPAASDG
jgi:hypothetical protein